MVKKFRFLIVIAGLIFSGPALAAPPSDVTGLKAEPQETGYLVSWQAPQIEDIAYYRLYFSSQSILQNGGEWQEYDKTEGPETQYAITQSPLGSPVVYVSVLAVNLIGEESEYFAQEIPLSFVSEEEILPSEPDLVKNAPLLLSGGESSVGVPTLEDLILQQIEQDFSQSSSAVAEEPQPLPVLTTQEEPAEFSSLEELLEAHPELFDQDTEASFSSAEKINEQIPNNIVPFRTIALLAAESVTPNLVQLEFSDIITSDPQMAEGGLVILDKEQKSLPFTVSSVQGKKIILSTETQQKNMVYRVVVNESFSAGTDAAVDPQSSSLFFTGHADGLGTVYPKQPAQPQLPINQSLPDVNNVKVNIYKAESGYDLVMEWEYPENVSDLKSFLVVQSRDQGRTFDGGQEVPTDAGGVSLSGIKAGSLLIIVHAIDSNGYLSPGIKRQLNITDQIAKERPDNSAPVLKNQEQPSVEKKEPVPVNQITTPPKPIVTGTIISQTQSDSLSFTGVGLTGLLVLLSGGLAGVQVAKKRLKRS